MDTPDSDSETAQQPADGGGRPIGAEQRAEGPAGELPTEAIVGLPDRAVVPQTRPLTGLELRLIPDETEVSVRPAPAGHDVRKPNTLWHRAEQRPGALVTLTSTDSRPRVVRLSVRSTDPRWNPRWVRWVLVVRRPPETVGGEAAAAQDVLSDDETEVNLLVLPDEKRSITLELRPVLDAQTYPGNYQFDVVATDVEDGQVDAAAGLLKLRHPFAMLLEYLPAIYRDIPEDASGLDGYADPSFFFRYLLGFQDALGPVEDTIANLHMYFGTMTTPPGFLPWLATWVSLVLDDNWPELKRRRLIREAAELYRLRGSRLGLSRYLEIYTGTKPEINDRPFEGMRLGPKTLLGRDTVLGDVPPHTFVVTLAVPPDHPVNEQIVRDIIDAEKPAHTAYRLRIVERETDEAERI